MRTYRGSVSRWLAVVCTAAFVALAGLGVGCSEDDIVGDATAEAVEAGLDDVLADTVVPLAGFLGAVHTIVGGAIPQRSSFGGILCPDTGMVCGGGGSAACTVTGGGFSLTFDFDQCVVVSGDEPFTLDGGLIATPGSTTQLTLNSLFINDSSAITGTGTLTQGACLYAFDVTTPDASVTGQIVQCIADDYPTNQSHLSITLDDGDVFIDISFDGSSIANAAAFQNKTEVANCTINMEADPLSSSCSAP